MPRVLTRHVTCPGVPPERGTGSGNWSPGGGWSVYRHQYRRHHRALAVLRPWGRPSRDHTSDPGRAVPWFRGHPRSNDSGHPRGGCFPPTEAIPYFGLIPLTLARWAAWQAWQGDDDDDDDAKVRGKNVSVVTVAGVTFARGGDNIGVYVPVFLDVDTSSVIIYCVVFLILVA